MPGESPRKPNRLAELATQGANQQREGGPLPTFLDLFTTTPLYYTFQISDSDYKYFHELKSGSFAFDCYCPGCHRPAPFKGNGQRPKDATAHESTTNSGRFEVSAICARHGHDITAYFQITVLFDKETRDLDYYFEKIGQTPSIEDILGADVARFKPVFSNQDFTELKKATGLASHGIGIGSFVYLRRIFERLIEKHRRELEASQGEIHDYAKMRMAEKIQALSTVLPPILVRNKDAYGILSAGIHELTEETCRQYFDVIRSAIIRILEQDLKAEQEAKADQAIEASIQRISSELKGKGE